MGAKIPPISFMLQKLTHLVIFVKGQPVEVRLVQLDRGYGLEDLSGKIHLKALTLDKLMAKL